MKKLWDAGMLWALVGLVLLVSGLVLPEWMDLSKSVGGVLLGVGICLMVYGACWRSKEKLEEEPEKYRQEMIEYEDERNTMIRNKAKARVGDIIQWFIMGIAYLTILIGASLWVTLAVVGVFVLKTLLEIYYMNKFAKIL